MCDKNKKLIEVRIGDPEIVNRFGREEIRIKNTVRVDIRYGTLKSAINELASLHKKYSDRYRDMHFEESRDCGCYYECHCSRTLVLRGSRYETDLERDWRLRDAERRANERRIADEKALEEITKRLGKTVS